MRVGKQKYDSIKDFLFSFVNKEFLIFLFFLALSAIFWCMITLNETYEKEVPVVLTLTGVPDNVVITDPLPDTVRLVVRDKGYVLMAYLYGDALRPMRLHFQSVSKTTDKGHVSTADLQKLAGNITYASTKIIGVKADKLDFTFNYGLSKRVPVLLDGQIKTADTYYLSNTVFSPDSVTIFAPKHILDSIQEVYTTKIVEEEVADTIVKVVNLRRIPGVKIVPEKVKVSFYANVLTEKIINVPITAINMPEGLTLRTFPSQVPVKVVFGRHMLHAIRPENFRVVADYKEISAHPSDRCTVMLRIVPKGILNANLEVSLVDYLIENNE